MFSEAQYTDTEILIYTNFVDQESVVEEEKTPSYPTRVYEENGVYYCASTTQNGVYWYVYCLNNPMVYTDPSGESILLTAAIIYGLFFTDLGYEFQKMFSPVAVKVSPHFGSERAGISADVSLGMPKILPVAYRWHYGASYYTKYYDNSYSGWETRKGSEVSLLAGSMSLSTTHFDMEGEKFDQTTSRLHMGLTSVLGFSYENDYFNPKVEDDEFVVRAGRWMSRTFGVEIANNPDSDKYRTANVRVGLYGVLEAGVRLYTGDPGPDGYRNIYTSVGGQDYYGPTDGYDPDEYRAGIFYIGVAGFRFGKNSESIRHKYQNVRAHHPHEIPYFKVLTSFLSEFYWGYGSNGNTGW